MNLQTTHRQLTDTILMVKPIAFRYNEQTAVNNLYQHNPSQLSNLSAQV
jgi:hypothetical protein